MAGGSGPRIDNEELRESYVMEAIYWDVLRGYLYDIENRIANIRSLVKKAENLETLNETPVRIAEARKSFADAMPGTDLRSLHIRRCPGGKPFHWRISKVNMSL